MTSTTIDIHHVDPDGSVGGQRVHHGPQRAGGAAGPADDPAQILGVDPDLEQVPAAQRALGDLHVVRVVDDPAHQVVERVGEHQSSLVSASASSAFSAAAASAAAFSS